MKVIYDDSDFDEMFNDINKLKGNYRELANEALNFYVDSFNNQGFTDETFIPWEKSQKDNGATLVLTGNLRNSIQVVRVNDNGFEIESNADYAEIHNEGGQIRISTKMRNFFKAMGMKTKDKRWFKFAHTKKNYITIPKRTFMDKSETLNDELVRFIFKFF